MRLVRREKPNFIGYEVSLERRKIYAALPDAEAGRHQQMRVVDESGEDYLFPASAERLYVLIHQNRIAIGIGDHEVRRPGRRFIGDG